ncbi:hypothetical protein AAVH_18494, partial [Aphelenchoides avenae]
VCSASGKPSCQPIGTILPHMSDRIGVVVVNTTMYISSVFITPGCIGTAMEVVRRGKSRYLVEWVYFDGERLRTYAESHHRDVPATTTYLPAKQDVRHFPESEARTLSTNRPPVEHVDTEGTSSNETSEDHWTDRKPGFYRPLVSREGQGSNFFAVLIRSGTLLSFDYGGYAFVVKKRLQTHDDHVVLLRYEPDADVGIIRRGMVLKCLDPPSDCLNTNSCY